MTVNQVKQIVNYTINSIYQSPDNYIQFLKTSANNFKYGFMDKILIHAQKPEAYACADMATWNKLKRWVNKGAESISLLRNNNGKYNLKFVFDVTDTNGEEMPHIWNTDDEPELISAILKTNKTNPYEAIQETVNEHLRNNEDFNKLDDNIKSLVADSIIYICLERCTHNADFYLKNKKFNVKYLQSLDISCKCGIMISEISSTILKNIALNVNKERERLNNERRKQSAPDNNGIFPNLSKRERSGIRQINSTEPVRTTPRANGSDHTSTISANNQTITGEQRNNGGTQRSKSDNVDTGNKQYPNDSKRNNSQPIIRIDSQAPQKSAELSSSEQLTFENVDSVQNYKITELNPDYGTASQRYQNNINAIRTLKKIESEGRNATPQEQSILDKYVGWGGLQPCFEPQHSKYNELKSLLTDNEYAEARASALSAFYTPPFVIQEIYNALENSNVTGKIKVLEPSCGIGKFFGLMPESIQADIHGIELDSISARIAQHLYPNADIKHSAYENASIADNSFDVAIGNVPFGDLRVNDKAYNKENFLIHDYFFAKTLDKVRPNGIIAFITAKGTMDKSNPAIRKYIAQRAELIGAIRLPNNTFAKNANTKTTSDIIFLKKRETPIENPQESWIHINKDRDIPINEYFIDNPHMILGEMKPIHNQYGRLDYLCVSNGKPLEEQLHNAILNINGAYTPNEQTPELIDESENDIIPADPNTRNFSYTIQKGKILYRVNNEMTPVNLSAKDEQRMFALIELRDTLRELISQQTENFPDKDIISQQQKLNVLYKRFQEKYGYINSRTNEKLFSEDSSFPLLSALEIFDENNNFVRQSDIFTKRTIKPHIAVESVETASDALAVSLSEKAKVDIDYMSALYHKSTDEIIKELQGVIYRIPATDNEYVTADEYLSGNIREKLKIAELAVQTDPSYQINVEALKKAMPKDLSAEEISVHLGATWISPDIYKDFIVDLLQPSYYIQSSFKVHYSNVTGEWNIEGKNIDRNNVQANNTYGTSRINAYKIIENALNLRDTKIYDYVTDGEGKQKAILNEKETTIAQSKQELIKNKFVEWIWEDPTRRHELTTIYNERFNSVRCREYNGEHIQFYGINPEITLRPHQKNAVARILYGGNTLLAHVVGAGKTYTMISAAQESKRLGLCNKSMFVVPNHLLKQWETEYLELYPSANILVATKKDFEAKNRKKFCGRIATGDYDAIIIGHSQFEKIPLSIEEQRRNLEDQLEEVLQGLSEVKENNGERFSIKQLEKTRKNLEVKLEKLNDQSHKDDVVTFEELGVDRLFVDEAHYYKNLYLHTKMRNISGIAQTEAQKSSDLYMKCRYLNRITNNKGTIFATGTPISNSMTELYTMQRYLQNDELVKHDLQHFDAWASTFGETVSAIELAPEGTGYRTKTRFSKFHNIPELMTMFRNIADIQTSDMLKLPVPKAKYETILTEPSEIQKKLIEQLSDRAKKVRDKKVDSTIDNMLKITNDGRKIALDQRLIDDSLPDDPNSKVSACANKVFEIWNDTKENRSTQTIFCDSSTPSQNFNIYDELKRKLIEKGIPENEIAFIHDAKNEIQKKKLFQKVVNGDVRIILGSTAKMGAGTNVQKRLIASHDLDCPWRPADLEQRAGRIIRQGNENPEVTIYRYVTKDTFDAYLFQMIENKQKFVSQIMTSKTPVRSADDIDEAVLSYAEIKSLATGNPLIKEKMDLDIKVSKLKLLRQNHKNQQYRLEDKILNEYPKDITRLKAKEKGIKADVETIKTYPEEPFEMVIDKNIYHKKVDAGIKLLEKFKCTDNNVFGHYKGLSMSLEHDFFSKKQTLVLTGNRTYRIELGTDPLGNIMRITNFIDNLSEYLTETQQKLQETYRQQQNAEEEVKKPFPQEEEYQQAVTRLAELNSLLNMDSAQMSTDKIDEADDNLNDCNYIEQYCNSLADNNVYNNERKFNDDEIQ